MREMKKMEDVKSTTWNKLFQIKAETENKSVEELAQIIIEYADCYSLEDAIELLNSEWSTVCTDGIIIWVDGE